MLSKICIIILLSLGLNSCVVIIHTQSPRMDSFPPPTIPNGVPTTIVEEKTPRIEIIAPTFKPAEIKEQAVIYQDKCPSFVLPERLSLPNVPDLEQPEYKTPRDIERALVVYIAALRTHIEKERKTIETAYSDYMNQCQKK